MRLQLLRHTVLTTLLLGAVLACQTRESSIAGPEGSAPEPEADRLRQDVAWLADDAREGRRAGTPGELAAARWIAQRLGRLGVEPAGVDGWMQAFEVPKPARDGGGSAVAVGLPQERGTVYSLQADPERVAPLFCSAGESANGRVVFGGYGIVAPELAWDDYGKRDLEGAVVVVVRGTPPDSVLPDDPEEAGELENPHGQAVESSGWGGAGSIFHKVMEAKQRGAAAVLIALHPEKEDEGLLPFDAGRTAQANMPALMIRAGVAEDLVPGYAELLARLDAGEEVDRDDVPPRMAKIKADVVREKGTAHNVLGRIPGRSSERTVVIGAHFDHLGHGGVGSLAQDAYGEIHNGADDNASGTAVALEIARCLASGPQPPEGDVVIALWSGEELGLLGSEFWGQNPTIPLEKVRANINLDMVGRADDGKLHVMGAGSAASFAAWLEAAGPDCGLQLEVSLSGQGVGGSDHQTFLKREIPALHFFTGVHIDYHKPSDDIEKFEADGARRVADLGLRMIDHIQAPPELAYVPPSAEDTPPPRGGFRTRFGSVPEYSYEGKGLLLAGTSPGSPAERAGLFKGDIVLKLGDVDIEGIGEFMYALNVHKPGDVVLVTFLREGEEMTTRVTLESNQIE